MRLVAFALYDEQRLPCAMSVVQGKRCEGLCKGVLSDWKTKDERGALWQAKKKEKIVLFVGLYTCSISVDAIFIFGLRQTRITENYSQIISWIIFVIVVR